MSDVVADILIYLLLIAGVGFGGIALMGLLIFPDIRSRMFTALRAAAICFGATAVAALVYAGSSVSGGGGAQYVSFGLHVLILCGVIAVAVVALNRMLLEKTQGLVFCGKASESPAAEKKSE